MQDERDIVTFTDDEGNDFELEVLDYVFYQGEEYAVLVDAADGEGCDGECCEDCEGHDHEHDHEQEVYIMKVVQVEDDMEEFVPIDDEIADALIEIVQTRFQGDFDDDDEEEDDDDDGEDEDEDKG